jgi:hypothetical protein
MEPPAVPSAARNLPNFAAVQNVAIGPEPTSCDVCYSVATERKAEVTRTSAEDHPSRTWTVLSCCSAPGSSTTGQSAVAICAVIGGGGKLQRQ